MLHWVEYLKFWEESLSASLLNAQADCSLGGALYYINQFQAILYRSGRLARWGYLGLGRDRDIDGVRLQLVIAAIGLLVHPRSCRVALIYPALSLV